MIDYDWLVRKSPLVVDTRNAAAGVTENGGKVTRCWLTPGGKPRWLNALDN